MKNTDKMKNIITFLLVFFTATTVWAEKSYRIGNSC